MHASLDARSRLLDASFVRELEALRRRLEIRARSGASGEHIAKRRGGSAEFHEHRAYAPGDDMRRIDWAAYARTGEPVLKLFRAEEDVVARLVCDVSASLAPLEPGAPSKMDTAKRVAAAIGYMTLAGSERAEVIAAGPGPARESTPSRGRGASLPCFAPSTRSSREGKRTSPKPSIGSCKRAVAQGCSSRSPTSSTPDR